MKIRFLYPAIIIFCLHACSYPHYLPTSENIDVNEYGAAIRVVRIDKKSVSGELIHADTAMLIVLTHQEHRCIKIPNRDIKSFTLRYAKSRNYHWATALVLVLPAINGVLFLFTGPIHLVGALSVAMGSEKAFTYNEGDIRWDQLSMFARYPQGLPPNVELDRIQ
ncbi:MAG: hypothetical protein IT266_02875 [Saprospiraceae bacterium]|nr:hypothetical protein [Saprospiraceae bacterium]